MGCCKSSPIQLEFISIYQQPYKPNPRSISSKTEIERESLKTVNSLQQSEITSIKINRTNFIQKFKGSVKQKYDLHQMIGEGSTSQVFRAIQKSTGASRAIKCIRHKKLQQQKNQEKLLQISTLKYLDHPNILKIFEIIEQHQKIHIVTQFCNGGELFDRIVQKQHMTENLAAYYMFQITSALVYCHQKGVVHRDLKPQNILLNSSASNSLIKIIDFGISKTIRKDNFINHLIGSAYYLAPEVLKGEYNQKCDIWSCGVILYILLSGSPPFNGKNQQEILKKISRGIYSFQGQAWNFVSSQAKSLVRLMLTKDVLHRPSAQEIHNHPWIQQRAQYLINDKILASNTLQQLNKFRGCCKIRQATFHYIATQLLSEADISQLQRLFLSIDKNGDGKISQNQLKICFENSDFASLANFQEIVANCDSDGNGFIEYSEFLTSALNWQKVLSQDKIEAAFKAYDQGGNGRLTIEDIKQFIGDKSSKSESWNIIFQQADLNGDGYIDIDEFKAVLLNHQQMFSYFLFKKQQQKKEKPNTRKIKTDAKQKFEDKIRDWKRINLSNELEQGKKYPVLNSGIVNTQINQYRDLKLPSSIYMKSSSLPHIEQAQRDPFGYTCFNHQFRQNTKSKIVGRQNFQVKFTQIRDFSDKQRLVESAARSINLDTSRSGFSRKRRLSTGDKKPLKMNRQEDFFDPLRYYSAPYTPLKVQSRQRQKQKQIGQEFKVAQTAKGIQNTMFSSIRSHLNHLKTKRIKSVDSGKPKRFYRNSLQIRKKKHE